MDFVTIDFETATANRDSPCEIGLTFVENRQIVETKSWLIKPRYAEFGYWNMMVHGISPEDVADEPEFDELWDEIKPLVEDQLLIAHNASFDFSVLRNTLDAYRLPYPELYYSCSYLFAKNVWQGLNKYDLKTLCNYNGIKFKHHRAGADSEATAKLSLKAFDIAGVDSIADFPQKLNSTPGQLYRGGYFPCRTGKAYKPKKAVKILSAPVKHNASRIFCGKTVVFTGVLSSMSRTEAQQSISEVGGKVGSSVTKKTDYLIVGQPDHRVANGMSGKEKKAMSLIKKGLKLKILSESEFVK